MRSRCLTLLSSRCQTTVEMSSHNGAPMRSQATATSSAGGMVGRARSGSSWRSRLPERPRDMLSITSSRSHAAAPMIQATCSGRRSRKGRRRTRSSASAAILRDAGRGASVSWGAVAGVMPPFFGPGLCDTCGAVGYAVTALPIWPRHSVTVSDPPVASGVTDGLKTPRQLPSNVTHSKWSASTSRSSEVA